jgi:hypothetical protein
MKRRIHLLGGLFGAACALGFLLVPVLASGDSGPRAPKIDEAAVVKAEVKPKKPNAGLKRIRRGGIAVKDDGCSE